MSDLNAKSQMITLARKLYWTKMSDLTFLSVVLITSLPVQARVGGFSTVCPDTSCFGSPPDQEPKICKQFEIRNMVTGAEIKILSLIYHLWLGLIISTHSNCLKKI